MFFSNNPSSPFDPVWTRFGARRKTKLRRSRELKNVGNRITRTQAPKSCGSRSRKNHRKSVMRFSFWRVWLKSGGIGLIFKCSINFWMISSELVCKTFSLFKNLLPYFQLHIESFSWFLNESTKWLRQSF